MPGKDSDKQRMASAYQGAVEAVAAPILCIGVGYWADQHYGSSPVGILIGVVVGFSAMVLRIVRMRPKADETKDQDSE